MAKYLVLIHGSNVEVLWEGSVQTMGFYKSAKVLADRVEDLFDAAIAEMNRDEKFMSVIADPEALPLHCELEEYSPWRFRLRTGFLKGATFYSETD